MTVSLYTAVAKDVRKRERKKQKIKTGYLALTLIVRTPAVSHVGDVPGRVFDALEVPGDRPPAARPVALRPTGHRPVELTAC